MSADNYGNEIPAAVQHTDEEYAYPPVGWKPVGSGGYICAAEEQFATHAEVQRATDDVCAITDELEARIVALETSMAWVHEQLRPQLPVPSSGPRTLTADYLQGYEAGRDAIRFKGDYADIPIDQYNAICAELEALRAFKASVPWKLIINAATVFAQNTAVDDLRAEKLGAWLNTNAPKPEAAE